MGTSRRLPIVLLSGPDSLTDLEGRLRSVGASVQRVVMVRQVGRPDAAAPPAPRPGKRRNLLLVTSSAAVDHFLARWPTVLATWGHRGEIWAVGPRTAGHLRALGIRSVNIPPSPTSAAMLRSMGSLSGSYVLHPRSDVAGPGLARELRRRGARVTDRIVYTTRARTPSGSELVHIQGAAWLLASSPSVLSALRRGAGARRFREIRATARLLVLGPTTASAARRLGFRQVRLVPLSSSKALPRFLAAPPPDGASRKKGRVPPRRTRGRPHRAPSTMAT
ncbi:MAG: uroporphyrinogen-III synthase [Euryarchaeota archaeon]|nr:uroporphyrinogen-III synthase [Euryarchaeota archaeon]MDE1835190.1 uroporphyrinogen-III synthase [Euryarchaeota archaeon]MDE1880399.1 uroporphyrinogen-III synthase [Euryarchaeota archaeon]MDE2045732.1 uroporphyrinogen-III synthase [Thermoplasmata archaeon]